MNAVQLLQTELVSHHIDIALICETWLTDRHSDDHISVEGYTVVHKDRSKRKGGGICMFIRDSIIFSVLKPISSANVNFELMWITCEYLNIVYYIALCYHPPKPTYDYKSLITLISDDLTHLSTQTNMDNSVILLMGDLNQLPTDFLETDFGLVQLVDKPTHGNNCFDKVFCNRPDLFQTSVFASLIKTKHCAILVSDVNIDRTDVPVSSKRNKVTIYDLRRYNVTCTRFCCDMY